MVFLSSKPSKLSKSMSSSSKLCGLPKWFCKSQYGNTNKNQQLSSCLFPVNHLIVLLYNLCRNQLTCPWYYLSMKTVLKGRQSNHKQCVFEICRKCTQKTNLHSNPRGLDTLNLGSLAYIFHSLRCQIHNRRCNRFRWVRCTSHSWGDNLTWEREEQ